MTKSSQKSLPTSRTLRQGKKQSQEPFPWMLIPLQRVREKESQIRGKAKVSPRVTTKGRAIGFTKMTPGVSNPRVSSLGISSHGISNLGKRIQVKAKARMIKAKAKAIKVKVVEFQTLSLMLGLKNTSNNLQLRLVINLNQKLLLCILWKKLCRWEVQETHKPATRCP